MTANPTTNPAGEPRILRNGVPVYTRREFLRDVRRYGWEEAVARRAAAADEEAT